MSVFTDDTSLASITAPTSEQLLMEIFLKSNLLFDGFKMNKLN